MKTWEYYWISIEHDIYLRMGFVEAATKEEAVAAAKARHVHERPWDFEKN